MKEDPPARATGSDSEVPTIAQELHLNGPYRSRAQQALLTLLRTADEARRLFTEVVADEGLTFQQYNVLRILRAAEPDGLPTLEIGKRMIERQPGVTRIVDRLERKGLVRRERDPEDRRVVVCSVTEAGRELLERLDDPVEGADDTVTSGLGHAELDRLIDLLDELRHEIRSE